MTILGEPFAAPHEDWMADALCAQVGGDLWHVDPGDVQKAAQARRVCAQCPVRIQCADWGIRVDDRWAILGGFTSRERWKMRHGQRVEFKPPKPKPSKPPQSCLHCGQLIVGQHHNVRFCDDDCRYRHRRLKQNETRRQQRRAQRDAA